MDIIISVNLGGRWVDLGGSDKLQGTLAYNWIKGNALHDFPEEFLGVKHDGIEYTVHKSCVQLRFVKVD